MLSDLRCCALLSPGEVERLQKVLDDICLHEHVAHRSALADEVGKQIVHLYRNGVQDSAEIMAIMELRFHRH